MQKLLVAFITILFFQNTHAQSFNFLNVPVFEDGVQLKNAWAGGMNAPQWSSIDLNGDGLKDLYAFDRHGNVHLAFINEDGAPGQISYRYARHWLGGFPEVFNYVMMRDFNRDGIADLFASSFEPSIGLSGIKAYRGFKENGILNFDRVEFSDYEYDILPFVHNGAVVNKIEVFNTGDYSAIDDLDGDGDLDILTMNIDGSKVLHYKNIAKESGFNYDTLLYELADDCWGRFGLTPFSQTLTLSASPTDCAFFQPDEEVDERIHGGTTFCTFDADNDGDKELLYGDLIFPSIIFATNGGSPNAAWMVEQDSTFPMLDVPVNVQDFPASYNLDVNNDGLNDLIFSPNLPLGTPDYETVRYYENIGTADQADFNLVKNDLVADEMLDFGTGAHPAFGDVNGDGLMDIVIGNRTEWVSAQGDADYYLVLLLNTGTPTEPSYTVVDRDWLGLKNQPINARSFTPNFGDIDNDGDDDLVFGGRWGFVHFAENVAGPNMPMDFSPIQFEWKNINVGANSTPFIFDVNKDGLSDLIIGERNGTVNYFPNIGTAGNPDFHPVAEEAPNNFSFGNVNTQLGGSVGYSQPTILPFSGVDYLITGTEKGWVMMYEINQDSLNNGSFELIDGQLGGLREGFISRVAFANINESGFVDMAIGNDRGGLTLFQSPINVDGVVGANEKIEIPESSAYIFPNPVADYLNIGGINEQENGSIKFRIYNAIGQMVKSGILNKNKIEITGLQNGIYFIELNFGEKTEVIRFLKN